jgi:hypothetical protein
VIYRQYILTNWLSLIDDPLKYLLFIGRWKNNINPGTLRWRVVYVNVIIYHLIVSLDVSWFQPSKVSNFTNITALSLWTLFSGATTSKAHYNFNPVNMAPIIWLLIQKVVSLYFPNFLSYSQLWHKRYFGIIKSELKYGFHIPLIKGYGTVIIANITLL